MLVITLRKRFDTSFSYADHAEHIHALMRAYAGQPMSFADACLVKLAEMHSRSQVFPAARSSPQPGLPRSQVFPVDTDFRIYRKHDDEKFPVLMP